MKTLLDINNLRIEEYVGGKMAEYKATNPVIFEILNQVRKEKNFINKPEVMLCLLKTLEEIKNQGVLTAELIITPKTNEQAKGNQGKNLYEEFLQEIEKWGEIKKDLAIDIGIALTFKITSTADQKKAREYMGAILKVIRLERESEKK